MKNTLKRSDAAKLIDQVITLADVNRDENLTAILMSFGIEMPHKCQGEAHNPNVGGMIDHCMCCAPHWGRVQTPVKVK